MCLINNMSYTDTPLNEEMHVKWTTAATRRLIMISSHRLKYAQQSCDSHNS
jgi:hypothetical protein